MKSNVAALLLLACANQASAREIGLFPVQTGVETIRFLSGVPTLDLETAHGAVQITPLPFDHGHVTLRVGVYNKANNGANFGIENVRAIVGGIAEPVLSRQELQSRAKSRAAWSQVGMALLAGAAAYGASQAYSVQSNSGYLSTPHGSYSWVSSYRDNTLGVLGATAATAGGAAAIVGIQQRLDYTLANLAQDIVQTTTVDPNASYGGRIVIEKSSKAKVPYDVTTVISWNGDDYPFTFRVTHEGVSMPPPYTVRPVAAPVSSSSPPVPGAAPSVSSGVPVNAPGPTGATKN